MGSFYLCGAGSRCWDDVLDAVGRKKVVVGYNG